MPAAAITATALAPRGEVSVLGVLVKSANLLEVPNQAVLINVISTLVETMRQQYVGRHCDK